MIPPITKLRKHVTDPKGYLHMLKHTSVDTLCKSSSEDMQQATEKELKSTRKICVKCWLNYLKGSEYRK